MDSGAWSLLYAQRTGPVGSSCQSHLCIANGGDSTINGNVTVNSKTPYVGSEWGELKVNESSKS